MIRHYSNRFLTLAFLLIATMALSQNTPTEWLRPGETKEMREAARSKTTEPDVIAVEPNVWMWSTDADAPRPQTPVLVGYHIKEAFGVRNTWASTIVYTDAFTLNSPGDELLNDLLAELAKQGKLEKVKGLERPERASITILSFQSVKPEFVYSTEQLTRE